MKDGDIDIDDDDDYNGVDDGDADDCLQFQSVIM